MAYVVQLAQAAPILNGQSMTEILNVSQPVGMQYKGAPNLYGDVAAVQGLIAIQAAGNTALAQPIPTVTGTFDSMTGYYIFDQQISIECNFRVRSSTASSRRRPERRHLLPDRRRLDDRRPQCRGGQRQL